MSILGSAVKGNVTEQKDGCVLDAEKLKKLQNVLLMILKDVDAVCRKNRINYILIGGSLIGCVRHNGFIPWDDDVDIAMTRKDYERFRKAIKKEHSKKYNLTDAIRKNNFGKNIPKLRLNNTIYKTLLKIDRNDQEITADIFIIENVPDSRVIRTVHGLTCNLLGALLSMRRIADNDTYFKGINNSNSIKIKALLGKLLCFASLNTWACWNEKIYSLCKNNNSRYISVPTDRKHYFGEIFTRDIVCKSCYHTFEDFKLRIPQKYDYYLSQRYGDYMKIPPKEKQVMSVYSKLDLGKYENIGIKN